MLLEIQSLLDCVDGLDALVPCLWNLIRPRNLVKVGITDTLEDSLIEILIRHQLRNRHVKQLRVDNLALVRHVYSCWYTYNTARRRIQFFPGALVDERVLCKSKVHSVIPIIAL